MNKQYLLLLAILMCNACNFNSSSAEEEKLTKDSSVQKIAVTNTSTKPISPSKEELLDFVPKGYSILGYEFGDLNKDALEQDAILILKRNDEASKSKEVEDPATVRRPLLILTRQNNGQLAEEFRNDEVVLCYACGGLFGDPFYGITIKNGYFSIEHYGGSNWRWTKIITFKFKPEIRDWYLHKIGEENYHTSKPDEKETIIKDINDFGKIAFVDYNELY